MRTPACERPPIMRPLRYSINVTLDGCVHHEAGIPDEALHLHHARNLERADALLFGRVNYQMMEDSWRPTETGEWPEWMADWMIPFAGTIDAAKKYVASTTLDASTGTPSSCAPTSAARSGRSRSSRATGSLSAG